MAKERDTDLIRIPKDLKLELKLKKGKDTYGDFLKKLAREVKL